MRSLQLLGGNCVLLYSLALRVGKIEEEVRSQKSESRRSLGDAARSLLKSRGTQTR
jgi:hypothetical protein